MRTTLTLENDAARAIRLYSEHRGISLGKAASELIRRGTRYELRTRMVNGIPVFDVPEDFPLITAQQVREILDEE